MSAHQLVRKDEELAPRRKADGLPSHTYRTPVAQTAPRRMTSAFRFIFGGGSQVEFRGAASEFIRHCQSIRKLSPHTARAYELELNRFSEFFGGSALVATCDRTVIHNYVRHLFDVRALKESSVKRHLATLRSFFHWLEEDGRGIDDPFRGARIRIRMPKRLPRVIARADLRRLLRHDGALTFADLTAYVATELLFATGMRVSELASLRDARSTSKTARSRSSAKATASAASSSPTRSSHSSAITALPATSAPRPPKPSWSTPAAPPPPRK